MFKKLFLLMPLVCLTSFAQNGPRQDLLEYNMGTAGTIPLLNNYSGYQPVVSASKLVDNGTQLTYNGQPVVTGNSVPIVTRGLFAVYKITDVNGTNLPDSSGNGNNATLCSGTQQPTLVNGGLYFNSANNQCVTWPANVGTNVKTVEIFYKLVPPPVAAAGGAYAGLFCSTNSGGAQFISSADFNSTNGGPGIPFIQNYSISRSSTPMDGVHLWDYYIGTNSSTDPDTVYQDGLIGTVSAAASASSMAAGTTYRTGYGCAANVSGSNMEGTVYYVLFYTVNLTPAEKLQNYNALAPQIAARGVNVSSQPLNAAPNVFDCVGDSLTAGTGTGIPYCTYLSSVLNGGSGYTYNVYGMAGYTAQNMRGFATGREILSFNRFAQNNITHVWEGTNDIAASISVSNITAYIASHVSLIKTARTTKIPLVSISTMISRTGQDTGKNSLNLAIRSDPYKLASDVLVDVAAIPQLGADGAFSNATYFQSDGIHLTVAGYTLVANLVANSWNAYFGSNINNCDPTVITAATYTGLAADGCKQFDTGTNSIAYTLFPATGMTSRTIYACNVSTTGSNTLTLQAASGEYFNASGTTSLTVAAGKCQQLRSTLVSASTGGDYWRTGN